MTKRKKKRACLSRRRVCTLPALASTLSGTPEGGGGSRVAFFAYFFGETKKQVARRGQSRQVRPKNTKPRFTEEQTAAKQVDKSFLTRLNLTSQIIVIPAQAEIHKPVNQTGVAWIPACAGMTGKGQGNCSGNSLPAKGRCTIAFVSKDFCPPA